MNKELKKKIQEGRLSNIDLDNPAIFKAARKYYEVKMLKEQAARKINGNT